jgi:hypothetical protein
MRCLTAVLGDTGDDVTTTVDAVNIVIVSSEDYCLLESDRQCSGLPPPHRSQFS